MEMADINHVSARAISTTCALPVELAQDIVRTRRRHGPFRCVEDLWKVEGMSTTAAGVLSTMYHIKSMIDTTCVTSTRRSPTKVPENVSVRGSKKISQNLKERYGSCSTNCKGRNVDNVESESDNEKEMVSIAVKNVQGEDHNTLARTAHVQKSPSGHKLYVKCEDIREYQITAINPINGVSGTSSKAREDSVARTEQENNLGNSKIDKTFYYPSNSIRNHHRDEFSETTFEFWNRIEEGRKDLELCEKRLNSPRVSNPTANWIHSQPDTEDAQNSFYEPLAVQNSSVTSKQNFSPERLDTVRSRGRKDGKSKSRERKRMADAGQVNAKNFDSLENVAGSSKQRPRPSRDRKKKSDKKDDEKKSRRDHQKDKTHHSRDRKKSHHSRDRKKSHHSRDRKKSDRKDREKKKTRGNKTETSDEGFCMIL